MQLTDWEILSAVATSYDRAFVKATVSAISSDPSKLFDVLDDFVLKRVHTISRTPKRLLALIWPIRANKRVSTISARGSATGRLRLREPRIAHNFAQTCPFPTKVYTPI